jgi:hypothetical protein
MMADLENIIAGLLGGGLSSSILSGDMPNDPNYRRIPGYDPDGARWAQISRALLEAGARIASAPRGQAVGQGLRGFIDGSDAGRQAYEDALLNAIKWRAVESQPPQDERQAPASIASPNESIAIPDGRARHAALKEQTSVDGVSTDGKLEAQSGLIPTEAQIDQMPLFQLWQIDPAQLSPSQRRALSRRLFREGF